MTTTLVLRNGRIRTPPHPSGFAQSIALTDAVITAVGDDAEIAPLIGSATRVIDLGGRLVLPAFGDAHVHALAGGLESLRCNLLGLRTRHEVLARIADWAEQLPADAWVLGGGWALGQCEDWLSTFPFFAARRPDVYGAITAPLA